LKTYLNIDIARSIGVMTIVVICFSVLCVSCAKLGTPTGGPKDTAAPKVIEEKSSTNYQTNFTEREVVLEFDEWVVIQNPIQEVVVSPPLSYPFKYEVKGKRTVFSFSEKEELKPDATYQINFGDAVKDFTAGNVFKNFIFVFSTGDKIDSLSMSGTVVNAYDKKPREGVLVMLYDNVSDTVVSTTKPFYFTKTDDKGTFSLQNLRKDTFRIYALKDENVNYIYDLPTEQVGFLDSLIVLDDSITTTIDLEIFDELDKPRLINFTQDKKGLIKAIYNRLPENYNVIAANGEAVNYTTDKDTVMIWHNRLDEDSTTYLIKYDDQQDTIINKKSRKTMKDEKLSLAKTQKKTVTAYKGDSISIHFNHYLMTSDSMQMTLSDTTRTYPESNYRLDGKSLVIKYDSLEIAQKYDLIIFPNSIRNIYGLTIKDTLELSVSIKDPADLGKIKINVINAEDIQYAIHLVKSEQVIREASIRNDTSYHIRRLEAGAYSLRVIEDLVPDNMWTPGNVILKRQSERIKEVPLEELRAGWDIEFELDIKQIFDGAKSQ
jgi:hypothetical protein